MELGGVSEHRRNRLGATFPGRSVPSPLQKTKVEEEELIKLDDTNDFPPLGQTRNLQARRRFENECAAELAEKVMYYTNRKEHEGKEMKAIMGGDAGTAKEEAKKKGDLKPEAIIITVSEPMDVDVTNDVAAEACGGPGASSPKPIGGRPQQHSNVKKDDENLLGLMKNATISNPLGNNLQVSKTHSETQKGANLTSFSLSEKSFFREYTMVNTDLGNQLNRDNRRFTALFNWRGGQSYLTTKGHGIRNWPSIQKALGKVSETTTIHVGDLTPSQILQRLMESYNPEARRCNFGVLKSPQLERLLGVHLPQIAKRVLELPSRLSTKPELLKYGENRTFYLDRNLASSLIANAVLCTFPDEMQGINPGFNFLKLYDETHDDEKTRVKQEKLKCIFSYFDYLSDMPRSEGHSIISYERKCIRTQQRWHEKVVPLCSLEIELGKRIEDSEGMLQVDFANRYVGGGVLGNGSVQEEIRFCVSPELLCSMLFTEPLSHDEVLLVTGTRIFSSYEGYGNSFTFKKLDDDKHPWRNRQKDNLGRDFTQVVCMDAWHFRRDEWFLQYQREKIERELHKSYVGFTQGQFKTPVATGNWGCGYFNGDPELKFLIQWMAASVNERPEMRYYVEGYESAKRFNDIGKLLVEQEVMVMDLYKIVCNYEHLFSRGRNQNCSLFEHVERNVRARSHPKPNYSKGRGRGNDGSSYGQGSQFAWSKFY